MSALSQMGDGLFFLLQTMTETLLVEEQIKALWRETIIFDFGLHCF